MSHTVQKFHHSQHIITVVRKMDCRRDRDITVLTGKDGGAGLKEKVLLET